MAKRASTPDADSANAGGAPLDASPAAPAAPLGGPSRLVIPLTATGKVDWDRAGRHKDAIRRVVSALKRDATRDETKAAAAAPAAPDVFSETWAGVLFDLAGQCEVLLVRRAYDCTPEQAAAFLYTDGERALLTGPLVRVLNKYSGAWLTQYADECALAGLLLTIHVAKIQALGAPLRATPAPRSSPAPTRDQVVRVHDDGTRTVARSPNAGRRRDGDTAKGPREIPIRPDDAPRAFAGAAAEGTE